MPNNKKKSKIDASKGARRGYHPGSSNESGSTLVEQLDHSRRLHAEKLPLAQETASSSGAVSIPGAFEAESSIPFEWNDEEEKVEETAFTDLPYAGDDSKRPSFSKKVHRSLEQQAKKLRTLRPLSASFEDNESPTKHRTLSSSRSSSKRSFGLKSSIRSLFEATAISAELSPNSELQAEIEEIRKEREMLRKQLDEIREASTGTIGRDGVDIVVASNVSVYQSNRSEQDNKKRRKERYCYLSILLLLALIIAGLVTFTMLNHINTEDPENDQLSNSGAQHNTSNTSNHIAVTGATNPPHPSLVSYNNTTAVTTNTSHPLTSNNNTVAINTYTPHPFPTSNETTVTVPTLSLQPLLTSNNTTVTEITEPPSPPDPPLTQKKPMLQSIRERGYIRCRAETFEVTNGSGFSIDLCKAVAAAIFGDPANRTSFPYFPFREQYFGLTNRSLDLATSQTTYNMYRYVPEAKAKEGFSLSTPYYFSGTIFAGVPRYVECAEKQDSLWGACRELSICVIENTITQDVVTSILPGSAIHTVSQSAELFEQFAFDTCNVVAGNPLLIYEQRARDAGYYTGDYVLGSNVYARDPFSMVTQGDDPQWADFVNWILKALITAEANNITQQTAHNFPTTTVFGPEYEYMFIHAIAAVGNYGEVYERHYKSRAPRHGMNMINYGDSGLMYSHPLREVQLGEATVSDYATNGTLDSIYNRGYLRCGIITTDEAGKKRVGLAEWNGTSQEWIGLDVDYCRAVAAGIFGGRIAGDGFIDDTIVYVNLKKNDYVALANNDIDILAGREISLNNDVEETKTRQGYCFSSPYYYHYGNDYYFHNEHNDTSKGEKQEVLGEEEKGKSNGRSLQSNQSGQLFSQSRISSAISLVTREDDSQWSSFVSWIVWSTVYAEEFNVNQQNALLMPVVDIFGMAYRQMFRDVILTVGNYGEMYGRNLESGEYPIAPRAGRNLLNTGGPQLYPFSFQNEV